MELEAFQPQCMSPHRDNLYPNYCEDCESLDVLSSGLFHLSIFTEREIADNANSISNMALHSLRDRGATLHVSNQQRRRIALHSRDLSRILISYQGRRHSGSYRRHEQLHRRSNISS